MLGVSLAILLIYCPQFLADEVTLPDLSDFVADEWDRDVYTGHHLDSLLLSPNGGDHVTRDTVLVLYTKECEDNLEDLHYSELPPQAYLVYTKHDWEAAQWHIPYTLQGNDSLYQRYQPSNCPTVLYFTQGRSIFDPDIWLPEQTGFYDWIWSRFKIKVSVNNRELGSIRVNWAGAGPSIDAVVIHPGDSAEMEGYQSYLVSVTLYQGENLDPHFLTGRIILPSDSHLIINLDSKKEYTNTSALVEGIESRGSKLDQESGVNIDNVQPEPDSDEDQSSNERHSNGLEHEGIAPCQKHGPSCEKENIAESVDLDYNLHKHSEKDKQSEEQSHQHEDVDDNSAVEGHQTEGSWLLAAEAAIWRQEDAIRHQQFNLAEIYLAGFKQASLLPKFTQTGVEVRAMPLGLDQALREHYTHHVELRYYEHFSLSPLVNDKFCKCSIVPLSDDLKDMVFSILQPVAEDWSRQKLRPTAMYGVREYYTGHVVQPHVDRAATHVISILLPFYTDLENGSYWPLEVITHQGDKLNLSFGPGEMLLYESASVIHGRPTPLRANVYAIAYVHFQPEYDWLWSEEHIGVDNKRFLVNGLNREFMEPMFVLATDATKKKPFDVKEEL